MNQDKIKKRVVRFIAGIALAIVFGIFAYISCSVAPHSNECLTGGDGEYEDVIYGFYREEFLKRQPKLKEDTKADSSTHQKEQQQDFVPEQTSSEVQMPEEAAPAEVQMSPAALKAQEKGLPAPPEIDINEWQYMLVNTTHTLSSDYVPELAYLNQTADETDIKTDYDPNRCPVDVRIAQQLIDFARGCRDSGIPVYLSSGYRSYDEQLYLFNRKVGQGYSEEVAKTIVAYPGTSEHQTGLCCDMTDRYRELKDSSLAGTDTFKWLNEHCAEYGFILRYPEDKSGGTDTVTGCIYEPWHFRYVGTDVAKYMKDNNLCLEEFVELYE